MTDYISREAAIKRFNFAVLDCLGMDPTIRAGDIIKALESIPADDVRPVVRGKWQSWEQDKPPCKWYSCDYCGFHALSKSNFCPNCGADMREPPKEET